jgi:hypothetical protein
LDRLDALFGHFACLSTPLPTTVSLAQQVCKTMGEKLTEEDVNSIMLNAPDDGMGGIEYAQFAEQVAAMADASA